MGKRAASKPASPPAKAKAPRAETIEAGGHKESPDDFFEAGSASAPVLELISQASGLSDACREMLLAMTPHCLKAAKSSRHQFQNTMVEVLVQVVATVEAENAAAVQASDTEVNAMTVQQQEAAGAVTTAEQAADSATQERNAKGEGVKSAEKAVADAEESLTVARSSVASLDSERAALVTEKEEFESLIAGTWASLKSGTIAGQKWRERAKLITGVVDMLDKLGLDASLKGGLPVALKTKPGERGKFAEKTVEYAETVLMKHVAALVEKLVGMEGEATTRSQAVVDAEAALTTAAQVNDQSADALLAAENVLAEKSKELTATMRAEKALLPKSKQLNATLEVAKENLAEVQALAAKFESLCQSEGPATTAAVEEMKQMEPETVCTEDQAASVEA